MYAQTCKRQIEKQGLAFQTPEERYDYAVSQLNGGYFEEAADQLRGILAATRRRITPTMGLRCSIPSPAVFRDASTTFPRAIELNPKNRLQARSDNDFQNMVDDPRFTELLYPEIP